MIIKFTNYGLRLILHVLLIKFITIYIFLKILSIYDLLFNLNIPWWKHLKDYIKEYYNNSI